MGPTASGKTALAEALADRQDAILVNADAFQVYRGFDIGTAKPEDRTRYRLLDIKDPHEAYGVGEWVLAATEVLKEAWSEDRNVVIVGGTGFYVRALLEKYSAMAGEPTAELREELVLRLETEGLDSLVQDLKERAPDVAEQTDLKNPVRVRRALEKLLSPQEEIEVDYPPFRELKVVLETPPEELSRRIEIRTRTMIENGWPDEVAAIKAKGVAFEAPAMRAIGYQTLWRHLEGEIPLEDALLQISTLTRQYAKRQRTWLRSEPRAIKIPAESEPSQLAEKVLRH